MRYSILLCAVAVMALSVQLPRVALADTSLTLLPNAVNDGASALPSSDFAPGWGNGSWQANGVSYSKMYLSPSLMFGHAVTLDDVQEISYWTKKGTTHAIDPADWYMSIYTVKETGDPGTWYGYRFNAEPYFSANLVDPAGTWNQWSTSPGTNQLRVFKSSSPDYFGSYTDGFLDDIQGTYGSKQILYLVMGTGSAWANGFTGQLDGLRISLSNGETAAVNFEAVPLPAAAWAGLALLGGLGGLKTLRRARRQVA